MTPQEIREFIWERCQMDDKDTDEIMEIISQHYILKSELSKNELLKDIIKKCYDEFLNYYFNAPCSGCPEGHSSFWRTIIMSQEWKDWRATNPSYDISECEELGIMSEEHFKDFIKFIKKDYIPKSELPSEDEIYKIVASNIRFNVGEIGGNFSPEHFIKQINVLAEAIHKRIRGD